MIKKYISAVVLVGIFTISLPIASAQSISQITPVNSDSSLPIPGIPNNPLSIILPLVEKVGPNVTNLSSSDITANFSINIVANKGPMNYVFGLSIGSAMQNIMNQATADIVKTQTQGALSYNIDQKLLSLIGINSGLGSIGFQTRMIKSTIGQDIYFKVTSITPELYNQIFKSVAVAKRLKLNTWYKVSIPTKTFGMQTAKKDNLTTYQDELQATKLLFSNVTLDKVYGVDTTTVAPSRHLTLGLSEQGILNIFNYISTNEDQKNSKFNSGKGSLSQEVFAQMKEVLMMPEVKGVLNNIKIDIWLGVNDGRIYKLNVHGDNIVINPNFPAYKGTSPVPPVPTLDELKNPSSSKSSQSTVDSILINFQLATEVKSLNKPTSIIVPKPALSFETFTKNLLGDSYKKAADARLISQFSNLRVQAEIYYSLHNNSYAGMCSDVSRDFGYFFNSLKKSNVTNCKSYGQNYLITLKVAPSDYLCVDNSGNNIRGKVNRALLNTTTCK